MSTIDRRSFSAALAAGAAGAGPLRRGRARAAESRATPARGPGRGPDRRRRPPRGPLHRRSPADRVHGRPGRGGSGRGVDVRGGAPGTRETDLLDPVNSVQQVHAVVLSGGSAFGLEAATGVVRYLEEKGIGFPVGAGKVPIVPRPSCTTSASATGRSAPTRRRATRRRERPRPAPWLREAWAPARGRPSASCSVRPGP